VENNNKSVLIKVVNFKTIIIIKIILNFIYFYQNFEIYIFIVFSVFGFGFGFTLSYSWRERERESEREREREREREIGVIQSKLKVV